MTWQQLGEIDMDSGDVLGDSQAGSSISVRFTDGEKVFDFYAAACSVPEDRDDLRPFYVETMMETRDVGDDDGNTSEYEYEEGGSALGYSTVEDATAGAKSEILWYVNHPDLWQSPR